MREFARAALDRAPFYAVARPLAGAALGFVAGGLYGALGGGLHAAVRGTPGLFLAWLLSCLAAGTAAGFLMGLGTAVDRTVCRRDWAYDEKRRRAAAPPDAGAALKPHNRVFGR